MLNRRSFIKLSASLSAFTAPAAIAKPSSGAKANHASSTSSSPGLNDSRRFLDQATMGVRPGEAAALKGRFTEWIDAQFAAPYRPIDVPTMLSRGFNNDPGSRNNGTRMSVFARWCNEPAQLRMRVAHVLSQIVCCAPSGWSNTIDSMLWWNKMAASAFGNYRTVLLNAVQHRHMGSFLNNQDNQASNGKAPSQNFARELLQLFSMGIYLLNPDGSVKRDAQGKPFQSYFQTDIDALARLLSGWGLPFGVYMPGQAGTDPDGKMNIRTELAYNGPSVSFLGQTFPALSSPTAADVVARANRCVDLIMAHPSTSTYISKQFITKMVTDSPSGQYVERVSAAFRNNGAGVVGDLKAVVKAVLLDPEARGDSKPASFGRTQEWTLSLTKGMRYAEMETIPDPSSLDMLGWAWASDHGFPTINVLGVMGQAPGTPSSVFNDYPFEFLLDGVNAPAAALWSAPAVMANVSRTMSMSPYLGQSLASTWTDATGRWAVSALLDFYNATYGAAPGTADQKVTATAAALVDRVFADLNQGRAMPPATRQQTLTFVQADCAALTTREKIVWTINFVRCLPESAVVI
ncbi:MAG: DUF1800 family protein [Pseudomonadota bacterium]